MATEAIYRTTTPAPDTNRDAQDTILKTIGGFWTARAVYAAAKLGIPDALASRSMTAGEVASALGTHGTATNRLLRALASAGILDEADGLYRLAPPAELLRSDHPASMRATIVATMGGDHYEAWGELVHSVQTGEIAFYKRFGMGVFDYYTQNPEIGRNFDKAMTGATNVIKAAVLESYDFSRFRRVIDVGGGRGTLLAAILKDNTWLTGAVYDLPDVAATTGATFAEEGVADRAEAIAGDFFASVPAGGDLYMMKWILHDWTDEQCNTILRNVRKAIAPGGRLVAIDSVLGPEASTFSYFMDINMLVMTGGRERTREEFERLYAGAGFRLTRVIPLAMGMYAVEAEPA